MTDTIATASTARRGQADVNTILDEIVGEVGWLTTGQFAGLIAVDGITGDRDTNDSSPVGLWVLGDLQARGIPAVTYSWMSTLCVYDAARVLIGEVRIPEGHTMYELDCEVNDGDHPALIRPDAAVVLCDTIVYPDTRQPFLCRRAEGHDGSCSPDRDPHGPTEVAADSFGDYTNDDDPAFFEALTAWRDAIAA